jgi:methyl-accepting chemotaxis protein
VEVNLMDRATQQNAAMAKETTAAARSLVEQAEDLSRLIGRFAIGRTAQSIPREAPRTPRPSAIRAKAG